MSSDDGNDDDVFLSPSSEYPSEVFVGMGASHGGLNGEMHPLGHTQQGNPYSHQVNAMSAAGLNVNERESQKRKTPSPTGYRGPMPRGSPLQVSIIEDDDIIHKTILLGDSGVGKTSLLVQFDTGKFRPGTFSATVGIGFTVLLLGDPGVGKTCLLLKYKDGAFLSGSYISTVGIDFRNKVINVDDSTVKLQIWDTAGQERFRSVTHAYYRDAHALLLLYDVMNKTSFDNTRGWLAEVKEYAQDDVVIMLIGNKCDIPASERQIRREDGERLAREYSVAFMETSAKTGLNVDLAFTAIAKDLKARKSSSALEKKFNVAEYVEKQEEIDHCTCSLI